VGRQGPACDCSGTSRGGPNCDVAVVDGDGSTTGAGPPTPPPTSPVGPAGGPPAACPTTGAVGECSGHGTCARSPPSCTSNTAGCLATCRCVPLHPEPGFPDAEVLMAAFCMPPFPSSAALCGCVGGWFGRCAPGFEGRDCSFTTEEAASRTQLQELVLSHVSSTVSAANSSAVLSAQVVLVVSAIVMSTSDGLSVRAEASVKQVVDGLSVKVSGPGGVPAMGQSLLGIAVRVLSSSAERAASLLPLSGPSHRRRRSQAVEDTER
jgi:hypothetical protein